MNGAGLGRLVEGGTHVAERLGCLLFLATGDEFGVIPFELFQTAGDTAVVQRLAGATADATFGGLGIRHKSKSISRSERATVANRPLLSMPSVAPLRSS